MGDQADIEIPAWRGYPVQCSPIYSKCRGRQQIDAMKAFAVNCSRRPAPPMQESHISRSYLAGGTSSQA